MIFLPRLENFAIVSSMDIGQRLLLKGSTIQQQTSERMNGQKANKHNENNGRI